MKRCKYSSRQIATVATAAAVVVAGSVFAQSVTVDQGLEADLRRIQIGDVIFEIIRPGMTKRKQR